MDLLRRLLSLVLLVGLSAGALHAEDSAPAAPKEPTTTPTAEPIRVSLSVGGVT